MYEDYMQNLLRDNYSPYQYTYEPMSRNTYYYNQIEDYDQLCYNSPYNNCAKKSFSRNLVTDIEKLYPEIYQIIYPMIKKALIQNTRPITENTLNEITNDIYNNIESENIINIKTDIANSRNENKPIQNTKNTSVVTEENRHINNSICDLIKILLIRELIDKPNFDKPPKPYFPSHISFYPRPPIPEHHTNISGPRY